MLDILEWIIICRDLPFMNACISWHLQYRKIDDIVRSSDTGNESNPALGQCFDATHHQ
jgi:hypothetical protein